MKKLTASLIVLTILVIPGYTQQLSELFNQVKSSVVVIHVMSKQNTGVGIHTSKPLSGDWDQVFWSLMMAMY